MSISVRRGLISLVNPLPDEWSPIGTWRFTKAGVFICMAEQGRSRCLLLSESLRRPRSYVLLLGVFERLQDACVRACVFCSTARVTGARAADACVTVADAMTSFSEQRLEE